MTREEVEKLSKTATISSGEEIEFKTNFAKILIKPTVLDPDSFCRIQRIEIRYVMDSPTNADELCEYLKKVLKEVEKWQKVN